MIWQSYDTIDVAVLDTRMIEHLKSFLQKKESVLSLKIVEAIDLDRSFHSALEGDKILDHNLNSAVEEFGKTIHLLTQMHEPKAISLSSPVLVKEINDALWEYVEVIEGSIIELFQQINQIGFEQWDLAMSRAVTAVKDELTHRMDTLTWSIRRLEHQLRAYRALQFSLKGGIKSIWGFFSKAQQLLDPSLIATVNKCRKYLNFRYGKFFERYKGCVQLYEAAQPELNAFRKHQNFSLKNLHLVDRYEHLFQLLNLWMLNRSTRALPKRETVRAVRRLTTQANAIGLFKTYQQAISASVFDQSRSLKQHFPSDIEESKVHHLIHHNLESIRSEISHLKTTIEKYRKFTIETDPAVVGEWNLLWWKRPVNDKVLKDLDHQCLELDKLSLLVSNFQSSLIGDKLLERRLTPQLENEVNQHFHEMDQPLASKDLMRRHLKVILTKLDSLDELGAFHGDVVDYVCKTLCRALLSDWKFHVIQEFPLFHKIYAIHNGLAAQKDDIQHQTRLGKFTHYLNQLEHWVISKNTLQHAHDIELDINDIKAYLQDFYAQVQRFEHSLEGEMRAIVLYEIAKTRQCLLEYLYLFGNFFHKLHHDDPEQWLLRTQLLFVDQYFKAINNTLMDLLFKERI